ncbi:IS6 family transposase, partial [Amylibacter sp.]|nr:IS6 family transposase [Amylibacter sp.]
PFRRRERAMQLFKTAATLQRFVSYHSQIYNQFNHERHLQNRQTYKKKRTTALIEWFQICAS